MEVDVKKNLKDAKEHVKAKDFHSALECCKCVLKHEKHNYLAWVLSAVCFQELSQGDKALSAFTKATELQPDTLTAWQGLAAFLEQERSKTVIATDNGQQLGEASDKLVAVYRKLENLLSSDPVKHAAVLRKQLELFGSLGQLKNLQTTASLLLERGDPELIRHVARTLSPKVTQLDEATLWLLESHLNGIVAAATTDGDIACKEDYLSVVLQMKQFGKAVATARDILAVDPQHSKSLETLCIAFVEEPTVNISLEVAGTAIDALASTQPNNKSVLPAKARWLVLNDRAFEAKQLLEPLVAKDPSKRVRILLYDAYKKLYDWSRAEQLCRSSLESRSLQSSDRLFWRLGLAKCLLEQDGTDHLNEVSGLLESAQLDDGTASCPWRLVRVLHLLRSNRAEECLAHLHGLEHEDNPDVRAEVVILKAEYLNRTGREGEAVQLLDRACADYPHNVDVLLGASKILWHRRDQRPKSVAHLMNAIKINRDIAEPYFYLGSYYGEQRQDPFSLKRARTCLEKAFQLNPRQSKTYEQLLELYRYCGDTANAVHLLEAVIQFNPRTCRWAWLQKGHLHLKLFQGEQRVLEKEEQSGLAVNAFQTALRMGPVDGASCEAMGDAYYARGAYSAALKAFVRATELDGDSVYAAYQTALTKHVLGEYEEAVVGFEALLARDPNLVPALKGLADTLLSQSADHLTDGFTGRVVDCCSKALKLLVHAAQLRPHLACLWSLMGHFCLLLRPIPESELGRLQIPSLILSSDTESTVTKKLVMDLGAKFFLSAVQLLPDSAAVWHNLALCYQSCWLLDETGSHLSSALAAVKKAITLEPNEPSHWDLLGLISQQPAVSQHAFIRALELNPNSPRAAATWTHLGSLYIKHGDLRLAHECFKQSQHADPFHVAAWIGQASVAELYSPSEAMDLFRHTVSIGSGCPGQCEGSPSYAHWVIKTLVDPQAKRTVHYRYNIVEMHAVPVALDGLVRYTSLYPDDSCAFNLLGLLYERQRLFAKAEESFQRGIKCLSQDECPGNAVKMDMVKANLARVYVSMDRYDDATELYASLQESELSSACGIALAHFKANRHTESYLTYEAALHWMATDSEENRSHLLVAMAMAAFRRDFPDAEAAKLLLFESCQLQPPSVYGLLALGEFHHSLLHCSHGIPQLYRFALAHRLLKGALGLLIEDETLSSAAFQELLPYQTEPRYATDITRLIAYQYWSTGNPLQGGREICRNVHMLPNLAELWSLLAYYQAVLAVQSPKGSTSDGILVTRCAEKAFDALRLGDHNALQSAGLSQIISTIALGHLLSGKGALSLSAAKKAVHCNPHSAASWSVMLAAALPTWAANHPRRLGWLKRLVEHLRRHCDVTSYTRLGPWLGNYERRLLGLLTQM